MTQQNLADNRSFAVALRKESVDRNIQTLILHMAHLTSLSARRAWIEIILFWEVFKMLLVALRKESVDRNNKAVKQLAKDNGSLSARRAWIEI